MLILFHILLSLTCSFVQQFKNRYSLMDQCRFRGTTLILLTLADHFSTISGVACFANDILCGGNSVLLRITDLRKRCEH